MEAIESSINGLESEITRHKKAATAHTSEQIDHGGFSLRTYIDGLYNRGYRVRQYKFVKKSPRDQFAQKYVL